MRRRSTPVRAGLFTRVSAEDLDCANQLLVLRGMARERHFEITREYQITEPASEFRGSPDIAAVLHDARAGLFNRLLIWSFDRLTRQGPEHALRIDRAFRRCGVRIISYREPELAGLRGIGRSIFISHYATIAQEESRNISERTKAGMARAKAEGKHVGRPMGAKDKRPRRTEGYFLRYQKLRKQ